MELREFLDYVNAAKTIRQSSEEIAFSGHLTQEALKITRKLVKRVQELEEAKKEKEEASE